MRIAASAALSALALTADARPLERLDEAAPFQTDVEQQARDNDAFRRVLFTSPRSQVALMTLPPARRSDGSGTTRSNSCSCASAAAAAWCSETR